MHIIRVLKFSSLVRCHWPALLICTFFSFVLTFALHIHVILSLSTTVEDNSSGVLLHQQICLIYLTTITRAPLLMLRLRYSTYMNMYVCIEQQTGRKIKSKRYHMQALTAEYQNSVVCASEQRKKICNNKYQLKAYESV